VWATGTNYPANPFSGFFNVPGKLHVGAGQIGPGKIAGRFKGTNVWRNFVGSRYAAFGYCGQ